MADTYRLITTATDTTLVAAPGVGKTIKVTGLVITAKDTDGTVILKSASTSKFGIHTPASGVGGVSRQAGMGSSVFDCAANEALVCTTSAAGSVQVNVQYDVYG